MVFLFICLSILGLILILVFSKIRLQIINFRFDTQSKKHINNGYKIWIKLYVLGFFPIFRIQITKAKLEKVKWREKIIKEIDLEELKNRNLYKQTKSILKKLNIVIKQIHLKINIGTENASYTSMIVPILSTIITILLSKTAKNAKNQFFVINPVYQNQNLVNLDFSGIFEVKLSHIINIVYKLNKKGVKNYERTSNRRSYDYSYE